MAAMQLMVEDNVERLKMAVAVLTLTREAVYIPEERQFESTTGGHVGTLDERGWWYWPDVAALRVDQPAPASSSQDAPLLALLQRHDPFRAEEKMHKEVKEILRRRKVRLPAEVKKVFEEKQLPDKPCTGVRLISAA
jgi:hypothetical protein